MIRTTKIFTKLFLSYILIILLSFMLFGFVLIYLFHINLYNNFEETYAHHYEQIEKHFHASGHFNWSKEETSVSLEPSLNQKDFSIFIFHWDGRMLYSPDSNAAKELIIDKGLIQKASKGGLVTKGGMVEGALLYSIASPLELNGTDRDKGVMMMVYHDLSHEYYQMIFMILVTFSITIAFAGIIIWFISRKITEPLRNMNTIALKYAKGDFSHLVEITSRDEIGQLGTTFNYMADELNRLEETRKDFIANLSHDLRSPLTSIKGFLIAMLDGTIPYKQRDHYYLLMKDETERVIKLVNDTLDMSQLEAGQIKLNKTPYNLSKQLQMIAAKLEPQLAKKQMEITISPDNEDIIVYADRDRIEQALINLLDNGIQFSKMNGEIKIFLNKKEELVQISIQDEGMGMSEEQLKHIWKRFYKTDRARTSKSGIGIGLSIVKSIMDMHDSSINVVSHLGEGTIFTFTLSQHERT